MPALLDIPIGTKYGSLTILKEVDRYISKRMERRFLCQCDCGITKIIRLEALRKKSTISCGCIHKEQAKQLCLSRTKHGLASKKHRHPLYSRWYDIIKRCYNPKNWAYKYYGGRGIQMCNEWRQDFFSFKAWSELNGYAPNLTIDRIDNNLGYSPENCQWITKSENSKKRWLDHKNPAKEIV